MSTRRAFAYSFVDRYAALILHTGSAMVIARLLTPAEIGVYSLTMVLLGFIATFRDLGAGQYLVQKKGLTTDDVRATWAVQLGLGLLFASIIALASVPVARFYAEPRMVPIMLILAFNFAITPFQALPYAWLHRNMQFGKLAAVRLTGAIAQALIAIGLAWGAYGPISLAWANLGATAAGIALAAGIVGRSLPWRPLFSGVRHVVSFGGRLTAVSLLTTIRNASPEMFLGKLQGMTDTGLFSRSQGLVAMFERLVMDAVNAVAFPLYAKEMREGNKVTSMFLRAAGLITALGWSFLVCLAILAYPVVRLLYGDQWGASVDPTRWLALAALFAVPVHVCMVPMLATGAVGQVLRVAGLSTLISVACVGIGAYFGLLTLSQMMLPAAAASSLLWIRAAKRHVAFSWGDLLRMFGKSALCAVAAGVVPLATSLVLGWRSAEFLVTLLIAVPGAAAGFALAAFMARHPIWDEAMRALGRRRA